jgi:arylsulfatase A-like enzyme
VIAHYWGFVTYVDALIGRVLTALDETGQDANSIVFATADHGEMAGHHRMFDKGPYLYEDVMRVPFIWRWPGRIPPRARPDEQLASHVEVVPTLLELADVEQDASAPRRQGRSLAAALTTTPAGENDASPRRAAEWEQVAFGETNVADKVNPQRDTRMIVTARWKYVYRPGDLDELYDLGTDPDELRNLAGEPTCRDQLDQLRGRLAAWMQETDDVLAPPA